jgi:hypothetical protein
MHSLAALCPFSLVMSFLKTDMQSRRPKRRQNNRLNTISARPGHNMGKIFLFWTDPEAQY